VPNNTSIRAEDTPLRVEVKRGELVIRLGIETLAFATPDIEPWVVHNDETGQFRRRLKVIDPQEFAKDVALAMQRQDDTGASPLAYFLDKMMEDAIEDGSIAVEECDEPYELPTPADGGSA